MIPDKYIRYGGDKYPWGNVPALDVLNLAKNEGSNTSQDFRLLFAGTEPNMYRDKFPDHFLAALRETIDRGCR